MTGIGKLHLQGGFLLHYTHCEASCPLHIGKGKGIAVGNARQIDPHYHLIVCFQVGINGIVHLLSNFKGRKNDIQLMGRHFSI